MSPKEKLVQIQKKIGIPFAINENQEPHVWNYDCSEEEEYSKAAGVTITCFHTQEDIDDFDWTWGNIYTVIEKAKSVDLNPENHGGAFYGTELTFQS